MSAHAEPHLQRRFGLLQATALNITNMIGTGPFITIPTLMATINGGGPQCMLGWAASLVIVLADSLIWAELGAAMPASGGTCVWLREGFGRERWGRLMAFLFIWQLIASGPMEIGTGFIGVKQYLGFLLGNVSNREMNTINAVAGALFFVLLYRRIESVGTIVLWLWAGVMITVLAVLVSGAPRFDPRIAFDFPPKAFDFSLGFVSGLGAATSVGIYDYLGYYDICYIGGEARNPGKVIPRSIVLSLLAVAGIYVTISLCIMGVVPWRSFVARPGADPAAIGSLFMQKIWGVTVARVFAFLVLWTVFGSIFTLALGYSRVPYAAARDGCFFRVFGRLHPTKDFPHVSLALIVGLSILFSFVGLGTLIGALLALRVIVQFIGQIAAVWRLRRLQPDMPRPFRIWLYPLPSLVALGGWCFIFLTTGWKLQLGALAALGAGIAAFLLWSRATREWPFGQKS